MYKWLVDESVTRELARGVLPLNIYTKFVWKIDLHNLFHFLKLRLDPHAQKEIRDYAEIMENFVARHFPFSHEAFVDYSRDAYTLSRMEVEILTSILDENITVRDQWLKDRAVEFGMSDREIKEFKEKFGV
jgi:thymidylate synthase (FAD)